MADPWLTIVGLGEDGLSGLSEASREAIDAAEIVFGGPRHLTLVNADARARAWPLPFDIDPVLAEKGRNVVVLASGDPFWHGAGGTLAARLGPGEWRSLPAPSAFSLAAGRMGWRLEETLCLALHAAPVERLAPVLARGVRIIALVRDGAAVGALAVWLTGRGFGPSRLTVLEALGGPRERIRGAVASALDFADIAHPVTVAIEVAGDRGLPRTPGLPDSAFAHDGQITKRPVRALTLSALAPRPGEVLWDLGAGSGSISIEWCLSAPATRAHAVEARPDRAANIRRNAGDFGLAHRLAITEAHWPDAVQGLPAPDAVFIGGGASQAGVDSVLATVPSGTRLVVNAVTLETEALLAQLQGRLGGSLMRFDIAEAEPLGRLRGWTAARPVVQWSAQI